MYLTVEQGGKAVFESQSTHGPDLQVREQWTGPGNQGATGLLFEVDTSQLKPLKYEIVLNISDNYQQTDRAVATLEVLPSVKYKVAIEADHDRIEQNRKLKFRASLSPDIQHEEYRFNFGDGTESDWTTTSEIDHVYPLPGIYRAFVITRSNGQVLATSNVIQIEITPKTVYKVFLEADKKNPSTTEDIKFIGNIQPGHEGVQYQFDFGDGTKSEWLNEPVTSHTYTNPGSYNARLIAKVGEEFFQSDDIAITVEMVNIRVFLEAEPNRTDSQRKRWIEISTGLLMFFGGGCYVFLRVKRLRKIDKHFKQTIQVRPKKDFGVQHIESDVSTQADFEVRLKSVLDSGKQDIETKGSLIIDERRNYE